MINVDFLVPYPELAEKVARVFQAHPLSYRMNNRVHSIGAIHCDTFVPEGDVVIARGTTATQLAKGGLAVPIVKIPISMQDVLHALQRSVQRYHPRRVALVGPFGEEYEAMNLTEVFHCEIRCFQSCDIDDIDDTIKRAMAWGCDVINGSYTVYLRAMSHHIPSLIVEVSDQSISQAFTDAVRAIDQMRGERETREMTLAILSSVKEGFIVVDRGQVITQINQMAKAAYRGERQGLIGSPLKEVFSFLVPDVELVISGKDTVSRQHKTEHGEAYLTTCLPVVVGGEVSSVVIHMSSSAPPAEAPARKRAGSKGMTARYHFSDIIHQSSHMTRIIRLAQQYAEVSSNILITGETGTGKELLAQSIHNASERRGGMFVPVNCATLPENLFESELFGYVEGAFTGTVKGGKMGLFELANGCTLFLDEISEIPRGFQSKLLRALQEREIRRVGDDCIISVDVRVISSTNQNLRRMVEEGSFRQDLYYRLDTLQLSLPPLCRRKEDIVTLFLHLVDRFNQRFGGVITEFSDEALALLQNHDFPGNVRELKNIAERLSVNCKGMEYISGDDMRDALFAEDMIGIMEERDWRPPQPEKPVSERELIERTLRECSYNQSKAARMLGINRSTLWRRMQKLHLEKCKE